MTAAEGWGGFALIGLVAGGVSMWFGALGWPVALGAVLVAALTRSAWAVGGVCIGLAIGAVGWLWLGAPCPAGATCSPRFPLAYGVGFVVVAVTVGAAATAIAVLATRHLSD